MLALVASSCNKEKKRPATGKGPCGSVMLVAQPYGGSTHIMMFDPEAGEPSDSLRSIFRTTNDNGVYNSLDNCYYFLKLDTPVLALLRYHFDTYSIDTIRYNGVIDPSVSLVTKLLYSRKTNKFYHLYQKNTYPILYEITINGNLCTDKAVFGAPDIYPRSILIDRYTGKMYCNTYQGIGIIDLEKNEFSNIASISHDLGMQYSYDDNMLYGINKDTVPMTILKIDPTNGYTTAVNIAALDIPNDGLMQSGFDHCQNLYVLFRQSNLMSWPWTTDIYWIEPKTGKVIKHVSPKVVTSLFDIIESA